MGVGLVSWRNTSRSFDRPRSRSSVISTLSKFRSLILALTTALTHEKDGGGRIALLVDTRFGDYMSEDGFNAYT
jgi:hypothetical protein